MLNTNAELLTPQDVARLAGVGAASVRNWERTGKLPAIRTAGGMRLFSRADVVRLMADRAAQLEQRSAAR